MVDDMSSFGLPPLDDTGDHQKTIDLLANVVASLDTALPSTIEIVLHDIALLPNSIVAISGSVTGRLPGDPATDVLLEHLIVGDADRVVGYTTRLPNGREMRSSTLIFRDSQGRPEAALCVNVDVSMWQELRGFVDAMMGPGGGIGTSPSTGARPVVEAVPSVSALAARSGKPAEAPAGRNEIFTRDIDELAALLIKQSIEEVGVPVDLMRKRHKLLVVSKLKKRGLFLMRDAILMVADALDVTRFTVYNYLNELEDSPGDDPEIQSTEVR